MRSLLQPVYDKNPDVPKADIWIAAGAFAVEATGMFVVVLRVY